MGLREYQEHDLLEVRQHFRTHRSVLLVQPTGAGKGYLASYIVSTASGRSFRVMFLVNRRTLVHDMSERVSRMGVEHGVIMGDDGRYDLTHPVQVASIQTVYLRREFGLPPADLLILDEAHFSISNLFLKVISLYPKAKILGMTATPIRSDGRGLGELYEVMVPGPSVASLIAQGYLVPSKLYRPSHAPDMPKLGVKDNMKQIREICDKPKLVGDVVDHWHKHAFGQKTVAFGVSQKHAWNIAEAFRMQGRNWAYVDDKTPDNERRQIWNDYDNGDLLGISNYGIISYGWDHPICSCIVVARATGNEGILRQMIGRGARPYPGKTHFTILDPFDNSGRLNSMFEDDVQWCLEGEAIKKKEKAAPLSHCKVCLASFRAGPRECPYCGAPLQKKERKVAQVAGDLREQARRDSERSIYDSFGHNEERKRKFDEYRQIARMRGYAPGWALMKFKALYGYFPPGAWRDHRA